MAKIDSRNARLENYTEVVESIKSKIQDVAENKSISIESGIDTPLSVLVKIDNATIKTPIGNLVITNTSSQNVTNYATAQVVDANLVAGNIKDGVNILGVTGDYQGGVTNHQLRMFLAKKSSSATTSYPSCYVYSTLDSVIKNNLTAIIWEYDTSTGTFGNPSILPDGNYTSGDISFTMENGKVKTSNYIFSYSVYMAVSQISTPHIVIFSLIADVKGRSLTSSASKSVLRWFDTSTILDDEKVLTYPTDTYQLSTVDGDDSYLIVYAYPT